MCVIFGNILGIFGNTLGIFGNTLGIFGNTLGIFGNSLVFKCHYVTKKLEPVWVGPCVVIKVLSDCLYQLQFKSKTQVLHNDRLKPYRSLEVPSWAKKLQRQLKHPEVTS